MQAFELDGYWHPSEASYDKVPGTLEFEPESGLSLKLMGRFKSYSENKSGRERRLDIDTIFGRTSVGGKITLTRCNIGSYTIPREYDHEGRGVTYYHPDLCFAGKHSEGGPVFRSISFKLTSLDEWVHSTDLQNMEFQINDETEIEFSYNNQTHRDQRSYLGNDSEDDFIVTFRFDTGRDFDSVRSDIIKPFQFFTTFGLREPVFPLKIYGATEHSDDHQFTNQFPGAREIDAFTTTGTSVVYQDSRIRLRKKGRTHPNWTLAHIEDNVEFILQNWYDKYETYQPLFDIFFTSVYYNDREYPSVTVLNLTRCLEAYHRKSDQYENQYISEDEFENYRKQLNSTIPEDFPQSFKSHLENGTFKFANRFSLRRRLKDIIRDHKDILSERFREDFDSDQMAGEIKNIRNDLTHLSDEDISEFEVEGEILYKLNHLIETVIADEVGFEPQIFPFISRDTNE